MSRPLHVITQPHHLALRFFGSLSGRPPDVDDEVWAEDQLRGGEIELWRRMSNQDRRHAIPVEKGLPAFAGRETHAMAVDVVQRHDRTF